MNLLRTVTERATTAGLPFLVCGGYDACGYVGTLGQPRVMVRANDFANWKNMLASWPRPLPSIALTAVTSGEFDDFSRHASESELDGVLVRVLTLAGVFRANEEKRAETTYEEACFARSLAGKNSEPFVL